jgi:hypothetical protein
VVLVCLPLPFGATFVILSLLPLLRQVVLFGFFAAFNQ